MKGMRKKIKIWKREDPRAFGSFFKSDGVLKWSRNIHISNDRNRATKRIYPLIFDNAAKAQNIDDKVIHLIDLSARYFNRYWVPNKNIKRQKYPT